MANVFLVDDDQKFLNLVKYIPLQNGILHTFSNPIEAIRAISDIKPEIIISDVQMPGIHGVDFSEICNQFLKHVKFIFISANAKSEIEAKYGSIAEKTYFRKPLNQDFFDFVDKCALDVKSHIEQPKAENFEINSKLNELEKLYEIWKKIQNLEITALKQNRFTSFRGDTFYDQIVPLERDFSVACQFLNFDSETTERVIRQFETKTVCADELIKKQFESIVPCSMEVDEPVKIEYSQSHPEFFEFKKIELIRKGDDAAVLMDNVPLAKNVFNGRNGIAIKSSSKILDSLTSYTSLSNSMYYSIHGAIIELLSGPDGAKVRQNNEGAQASIVFTVPYELANGEFITEVEFKKEQLFWKVDFKNVSQQSKESIHRNFKYGSLKSLEIKYISNVKVTMNSQGLFDVSINNKPVVVPYKELVDDELRRGFVTHDTKHFMRKAAMRFAWDCALKK